MTIAFSVNAIRRWHATMGGERYPVSDSLMIAADGGGSNGWRVRLRKVELQKLADETGLRVSVCHNPPGASKWNKIEHRLFRHITQNWRGRPLTSRADVSEENVGRMMLTGTAQRQTTAEARRAAAVRAYAPLRRFLAGDYAPSLVLAFLILLLGVCATAYNARFISPFNIEKMLLLVTALCLVGFGQLCAIFTGGIDLSVGPLVGLSVVVSSFFFTDEYSAVTLLIGVMAMFACGAAVGLANGSLVRFGNFTAFAAPLGVYVLIQGASLLLRPFPGGNVSTDLIDAIQWKIGAIPVAFVLAAALCVALEVALRHTRWGLSIRAVGSNEIAASRIGVQTNLAVVGAFIACCLLTIAGSVMVSAQLGIGDPKQGVEYTLASIAAVVLGGASLFGGRGSFLGVLFGAVLIIEINSVTSFLGLSEAWQYWFIGFLTLGAVAVYSQARMVREA